MLSTTEVNNLVLLLVFVMVIVCIFLLVRGNAILAGGLASITILVALIAYNYQTNTNVPAIASAKDLIITSKQNPNIVKPLSYLVTEVDPYTPQQVGSAYLGSIPYSGRGQKIGIIGCYNHVYIQRNFNNFNTKYDLPIKQLQVHNHPPTQDAGWALEACLDTQWANVFAPNAEIHLFQANDASFSSVRAAIQDAVSSGMNIISMSLGSTETLSSISPLQDIFDSNPNIIFLAASGDYNYPFYPSTSNKVISVGGTVLRIETDRNNNSVSPMEADYSLDPVRFKKIGEYDWAQITGYGSGHGISAYFNRPSYQNVHNASDKRSVPDLSLIAATPTGGVSIYYSTSPNATYNTSSAWVGVRGTSLSCPILAGMIATINGERIRLGKAPMTRSSFLGFIYGQVPTNLAIETSSDGAGYVGRNLIPLCVRAP